MLEGEAKMKIVIAGGGKVGEVLCRELSLEKNDIVLIENNPTQLERIIQKNDITGMVGKGENYDHLVEAGVADCDIFIAVTPKDEINIIAAIIAQKLGANHTIARVRNPVYAKNMEFVREDLGISIIVNPELEAAKEIFSIIQFPEALSVEQFFNGKVSIIEEMIQPGGQLDGMPLTRFRIQFGEILVCAIERGDNIFIPRGDAELQAGDHIFVTGCRVDLMNFLRRTGYKGKKAKSALIIGGSRIAYYLIPMLAKLPVVVKIIENNPDQAKDLSETFPEAIVVQGDGTDQEFLKEEHMEQYDVVIGLTGIDEENILISLFAMKQSVPRAITKVNRTDLLETVGNLGLQTIITPKRIIANEILTFARSFGNTQVSNIEKLYRIANDQVEALEFIVNSKSKIINIPLKDLNIKENLLIAYMIRFGKLIFPGGEDEIKVGDHVIVVTTNKNFDDIDDILF